MNELSPSQAAAIAKGVYGLINRDVQTLQARGQTLGSENLFHVDDSSRFTGRSGNMVWHSRSGSGREA